MLKNEFVKSLFVIVHDKCYPGLLGASKTGFFLSGCFFKAMCTIDSDRNRPHLSLWYFWSYIVLNISLCSLFFCFAAIMDCGLRNASQVLSPQPTYCSCQESCNEPV